MVYRKDNVRRFWFVSVTRLGYTFQTWLYLYVTFVDGQRLIKNYPVIFNRNEWIIFMWYIFLSYRKMGDNTETKEKSFSKLYRTLSYKTLRTTCRFHAMFYSKQCLTIIKISKSAFSTETTSNCFAFLFLIRQCANLNDKHLNQTHNYPFPFPFLSISNQTSFLHYRII